MSRGPSLLRKLIEERRVDFKCTLRLQAKLELLQQAPEAQLAVLFGSHAHHAAAQASDVDLGILLETGRDRSHALQVTLERALGRVLDIIWLDDAPPLLRLEIAGDGLVVVERAPGVWAAFQARGRSRASAPPGATRLSGAPGKPLGTIQPLQPGDMDAVSVPPYAQAWAEIEDELRRSAPAFPSWREAEDASRGRR